MKEKRSIAVFVVSIFKETLYIIKFIELQVLRNKIQFLTEKLFLRSIHHQIK